MARVALLVGGPGPEHAASLATGAEILRGLAEGAHAVRPVWISPDARWTFGTHGEAPADVFGHPAGLTTTDDAIAALRASGETAYLALHGVLGIDGRLQRLLEDAGVPYTGSGPDGCALTFDRDLSKLAVARVGGRCAKHEVVAGTRFPAWGIGKGIGYPCVTKPVGTGRRAGVTIAESEDTLREAVTQAQDEDPSGRCMVEEFVDGHELHCCVLRRDGRIHSLPLVALAEGRVGPADELAATTEEVVRITRALYAGLELRGLVRVDFLVPRDGGRPVFLEALTSPDGSQDGLAATAAHLAGISSAGIVEAVLADTSPALPTRRLR